MKTTYRCCVLFCAVLLFESGTPLVILHTNDVHSQLDPNDAAASRYPNHGGILRREALLRSIRKEVPHVLVVESGDFVQGTAYFNHFQGKAEVKMMNQLRLDAITLGNHEFDHGLLFLSKMLKASKFPIVCTNYDFSSTILKNKIKPWCIVRKGKLRIGIVSANISPYGSIDPVNFEGVKYRNPLQVTDSTAAWLKRVKRCDVVVCLSHLGFVGSGNALDDKKLAASSTAIDVIVGGHTHTFMKQPFSMPNANGEAVYINQAGKGGVVVGRMDFDVIQTE